MLFKILIGLLILNSFLSAKTFEEEQNQYKRVKEARKEKIDGIKKLFKEKKIPYPANIFIRIFKFEEKFQVFALNGKKYELVKEYPICSSSGELGPKRQQGDMQVPEGFYYMHHYNPLSNFHLSLGVSYPNKSDTILKTAKDAGGAIYIHGDCVTIGCVPLTDNLIKEVYTMAVDAKTNGQTKIEIHIFPCDFNTEKCKKELETYKEHTEFWENIKIGYEYFENNKTLPKTSVNAKGEYKFK